MKAIAGSCPYAIRDCWILSPERATVRQLDGSWLEVDVKSVGIGALVRVRPGELSAWMVT